MNREDLLRRTFEEWTNGLDPVRARVELFERVRDLPYVYPSSRDPVEVLAAGQGSASGKHHLLAELFRLLGLEVRHVMCTHRFNESAIAFPKQLQVLLEKNEITDIHEYLQVAVDGQWVDVDATWPRELREFGFPVNDEWDGRSPMLLSVAADEVVVVRGNPEKAKDELLATWTPRQRQLRHQFLLELSAWVKELYSEATH
ncbi:MAG: hypothetical protein KatS3mg077_0117 [Candidatus Binatia bacterium]|nr:MAG: hypothetical protein KatS3mg077_0117 [Candidatus Binatia bacterium]